jgi:hypothetical protein
MIYSIVLLTSLYSIYLLVFVVEMDCVPCEEEPEYLNKIYIISRLELTVMFYYIIRIVLLFVQNLILKDRIYHNKHFMKYCFSWNAVR